MPIDSADDNDSDTNVNCIVYNVETELEDNNIVQEEPSESAEAKLSRRNHPYTI